MELSKGTTLQNGKYRIVEVLGTGGFGITYLAQMKTVAQGELGAIDSYSNVAIKEFFMKTCCNRNGSTSAVSSSTETNKETFGIFRKKFEKEARILAQLKYPGIVPVLEIFQENGTSYYVMEFVSGRSINQLLDENGTFDVPTALRYINHVGEALKHVHDQNYLHLDIKPDNILVRNNEEPVLIDFGGAKHFTETGDTESTTTPPVHSDGYSPMEVYSGINSFAPEADVYSLAATFYKMITGIRPAKALELSKNPLKFNESIPSHVRYAITMAMQVLPENRTKTVEEFLGYANGTIPVPPGLEAGPATQTATHGGKAAQGKPAAPGTDGEDTLFLNTGNKENTLFIPNVNRVIPPEPSHAPGENDEQTQVFNQKKSGPQPQKPAKKGPSTSQNPRQGKAKKSYFVPAVIVIAILAMVVGFVLFSTMRKKAKDTLSVQEIDSLEVRVDSIIFYNFGGKARFISNLKAYADSMDGFKVDACENIYKDYYKVFQWGQGTNRLPSLHSGISHENILFMCDQMSQYATYWQQQCTDMGNKTEAANYGQLSTTWKQRKETLTPNK